jgi:Na+:H+ antiporter, NhaC family
MDLLFVLIFSFVLLLVSVAQGIFIAYPLLLTLSILIAVYVRRGFQLKSLLQMAFMGSQKSFSVLSILLLIGAVTAVWMAAGTVPALVYYGLKLINPQYFVLSVFILTSFVSLLIGTSFGTVSTIGIALMVMARGSDVDPHLIAGAIIAGAYFGDRCSPMSSSAHLVASVTGTKIYTNLKNMVRTAIVPLVISTLIYSALSRLNPVQLVNSSLTLEIPKVFEINLIVLLPALVVLILSLFRVEVKLTMLISLIAALAIGIGMQGYSLTQLLKFMMLGYSLEEITPLQDILSGGGVVSMARVSGVVIVSTGLAGIFSGTRTLDAIEVLLKKAKSRSELFLGTTVIGIASAAFGCTQTIAILLTQQLVQDKYEQEQLDNYQLAVDLENTAVVLSPLVPWNIAGLVPATLLMTDSGFIPYAFYLYLLPLFSLVQFKLREFSLGNKS